MKNLASATKKIFVLAVAVAVMSACGLTALAAEDGVVKQDIDSVLAMAKPMAEDDAESGEILQDKLLGSRELNG